MEPNARGRDYSVYRPDLADLGAKDGFMPSGRPISNNDPLSRRDAGLEFLNVTSQARTELTGSASTGRRQQDIYRTASTGEGLHSQSLVGTGQPISRPTLNRRFAAQGPVRRAPLKSTHDPSQELTGDSRRDFFAPNGATSTSTNSQSTLLGNCSAACANLDLKP